MCLTLILVSFSVEKVTTQYHFGTYLLCLEHRYFCCLLLEMVGWTPAVFSPVGHCWSSVTVS